MSPSATQGGCPARGAPARSLWAFFFLVLVASSMGTSAIVAAQGPQACDRGTWGPQAGTGRGLQAQSRGSFRTRACIRATTTFEEEPRALWCGTLCTAPQNPTSPIAPPCHTTTPILPLPAPDRSSGAPHARMKPCENWSGGNSCGQGPWHGRVYTERRRGVLVAARRRTRVYVPQKTEWTDP